MIVRLRRTAKRSTPAIIAYYVLQNWRAGRAFRRGDDRSNSGSTHLKYTTDESVNYINEVFADYFGYSRLTTDTIHNKRILEIGPGDNLGVALKFLANGAMQVVSLDKFYSNRDPSQQKEIYLRLRAQLSSEELTRYDDAITIDKSIAINPKKLIYIHGTGIEDGASALNGKPFDFIVSRAVVETLYNTDAAFSVMDRLLAPGGYMIHKIDLRDHGMFTTGGHHSLTFLTIPDGLYSLMTKHLGCPNRRTVGYYQDKMRELGYTYRILVTHVLGQEKEIVPHREMESIKADVPSAAESMVRVIRPRLQAPFRVMSDAELAIQGVFLVAYKQPR